MKTTARLLTLFIAASAFAQNVPPPPRPVESGPSLAETMKFLQEKIGGQGPLNYVLYYHDNIKGNDWAESRRAEITNVRTSPEGCRIDFHFAVSINGQVKLNVDAAVDLRAVAEIAVLPFDQMMKQIDSQGGHPEFSARVDPALFGLWIKKSNNVTNEFDFNDESLANRVAKALLHAVELCGGGSKEPF